MNERDREFLEGMAVYFKLLKQINAQFLELVSQNISKEPYENEELFYVIVCDLLRLLPLKGEIGKSKSLQLDCSSGIMLLKRHLPFLETDYNCIIENPDYIETLVVAHTMRNKYTHEPHNMHFACSVGSKTSYSVGMYYKDDLLTISTISLADILYELNLVFEKIKKTYIERMQIYGDSYTSRPCYMAVLSFDSRNLNSQYSPFLEV